MSTTPRARGLRQQRHHFVGVALAAYAALSTGTLVPAPALASTGKAPIIATTGWGSGGEISVHAQINPEGLETSYEIRLACGSCGPSGYSPSVGVLPAVDEELTVNLDLTGIKPGTYTFDVYASNSAGQAFWSSQFEVPPIPPGACPEGCSTTEPYKPEVSQASIEANEREAVIVSAEAEARRHQEAREYEERKSKEAVASHAAEVAALRKRTEEEETEERAAATLAPACVVPSLKGDTLSAARRALAKAHCRLGKVNRPAPQDKTLLVTRQSPKPGERLPARATIEVTLGNRHKDRTA
jgi:hypothetical protein